MKDKLSNKIKSHDFEMKEIKVLLEKLNTTMKGYTVEYTTTQQITDDIRK
jgi:hypothetical protein